MTRGRWLSIGVRLALGLVLAWTMYYVPRHHRSVALQAIIVISVLGSLLVQSSFRKFDVLEFLVIASIVFVLGCLLLPAAVADHSRRHTALLRNAPHLVGPPAPALRPAGQ
jgi:hypothetical protein